MGTSSKYGRTLSSLLLVGLLTIPCAARDAARDLRKMVGFTIVAATSVSKVVRDPDGFSKTITLADGNAYKLTMLMLDPLVTTDVIVFAKPYPKELQEKYKDLPESLLFEYRLLIDNEVYEATAVQ